MRSSSWIAIVALVGPSLGGAFVGCGGDDASVGSTADDGGDGSMPGSDAGSDGFGGDGSLHDGAVGDGASPACATFGQICAAGSDCCSGACDSGTHTCAANTASCSPAAAACAVGTDCCSLSCVGFQCSAAQCTSDHVACTTDAQCCSGTCAAGVDGGPAACAPLNTTCETAGNACATSGQCCSGLCNAAGTCVLGSSFCVQPGDVCSNANDCCTGICNVASGNTLGTCGAPPTGSNNCQGNVDGVLCASCGACCSALCAPYGPTGIDVCQPANGCHVEGDLCRADTDCCGGDPDAGLPTSNTPVSCQIPPGGVVGTCRSPMGCRPEGETCHYMNYACSNSTRADDCCGAPGNSGACTLDALGVPRCHAIGTCRTCGESCSNDLDCCANSECLPGSGGSLVCTCPTIDGGPSCSPNAGTCTTTADCCSGYTCEVPPGGTTGTCGTLTPPPPPSDGGTSGDSGVPLNDGGMATCSQYGQSCATASDCCNGIPCRAPGNGAACGSGQTGCTCVEAPPP